MYNLRCVTWVHSELSSLSIGVAALQQPTPFELREVSVTNEFR